MQAVVRVLLALILLIAAGLLSYDMASYYLYSPWTRDARVRANVVTVAPDVSGYVDDIRVRNNQFVHKDDVLFVIDQDRFRLAGKRRSSGRGGTRSVSHVARSIPAALEAIPRGHHHH
jgi:multidrug resistance efflux pump